MLNVAAVFSDHMVLQRQKPIAVFGEADGPVKVSLAGAGAEAVPANGRFEAFLPPMEAGGPFELKVTCGGETRAFSDVMVGEVWLCGGQSNMEFMLMNDRHGARQVAEGDDALLCFYTVNQEGKIDEAMLARERATAWKPLSPGACGDVSAVACYAGQMLRERLGVAVGMLICCVGGTEACCWVPGEALREFPEGRAKLAEFERNVEGITEEMFERADAEYRARVDAWCAVADAMKRADANVRAEQIIAKAGDFPWPPPTGPHMLRRPGGLWENMTARITPYTARGLFWYQGETDSGNPGAYPAMFTQLIRRWRQGFRDDGLWVVAAQLPGFGADPAQEDWPGIRGAQQAVCDSVPGCALACLLDLGERNDIHPWDKRPAARRMAALALEKAYGLEPPESAEAPRLVSAGRDGDAVVLRFSRPIHVSGDPSGLTVNGGPAAGLRVGDGALRLDAPAGARVAYAQENWPEVCLYGDNGLPAFPFEIEV